MEVGGRADATIARVIVKGRWNPTPAQARSCLRAVVWAWPDGARPPFLITPGGFFEFTWPTGLDFDDPIEPSAKALNTLRQAAEAACAKVLTPEVRRALRSRVRVITLGVDSYITPSGWLNEPHVELVGAFDLRTQRYHWTGKTYPTACQARGLVPMPVTSHFARLAGNDVMLLGCHDLNLFSPRAWANAKGWRRGLLREFRSSARAREPSVVLQHPHTTDAERIWSASWGTLQRTLPTVEAFAGAGKYWNPDGRPRGRLEAVLRSTQGGGTLDFIVSRR